MPSATTLDSNIFKNVLLDLLIESSDNFYGNKSYIITYRSNFTAAPTIYDQFQTTIYLYKYCSYA